MISLTLSLLSLIALSVAQNQTVSLFLPNADLQSLVGSIVGGDATATTYVIQCANGGSDSAAATTAAATTAAATAAATTDLGDDGSDICGLPTPITLVEGPSTVAYSLALDDSTVAVNCVLSGSSVAVCTAGATGAILTQESVPISTATTLSGTDVSFLPVVITAGSVTNTASTPTSTASTTGAANGAAKEGSTSSTGSTKGSSTSSSGGTQTQTGSTISASTKASGAAIHMGPAMGMGAAGALAVVAAVVL
ncbi:MAG: hypothetical protein Q9161_008412 [Pseudevernia consocians]